MDTGKYIDFSPEQEHQNTMWAFVPHDKNFIFEEYRINNAKLGDSDSIYCSIPKDKIEGKSTEEIVSIADRIANEVNSSYPDFLKEVFNCPDDRTNEIQSNREIVADVVFVSSKKRYAAHVVDNEGTPCDKLKIMGLEIKKSDTPQAVKGMLSSLVNAILDGQTEEEVNDLVNEMKNNYSRHSLRDIARPISVKGLRTYEDQFQKTGSMNSFPYNIRAAMFYNLLRSNSDRKIVPGDKIGIVYINHPDSKYIGFPIDEKIPDFVLDMDVDYETQWDKAFTKIHSYMSSVGWDFKSKKEEVRTSLFGAF